MMMMIIMAISHSVIISTLFIRRHSPPMMNFNDEFHVNARHSILNQQMKTPTNETLRRRKKNRRQIFNLQVYNVPIR